MRDHLRVHVKKTERLRTRAASRARNCNLHFHELKRLCAPSAARLYPNHDQAAPVVLEQFRVLVFFVSSGSGRYNAIESVSLVAMHSHTG